MKDDYKYSNEVIYVEPNKSYKINDIIFDRSEEHTLELRNTECDYIFIPIGGTYTMDLNEALSALSNMNYEYVIPYHYGSIVGDISLGNKMKEILKDKCIVILK